MSMNSVQYCVDVYQYERKSSDQNMVAHNIFTAIDPDTNEYEQIIERYKTDNHWIMSVTPWHRRELRRTFLKVDGVCEYIFTMHEWKEGQKPDPLWLIENANEDSAIMYFGDEWSLELYKPESDQPFELWIHYNPDPDIGSEGQARTIAILHDIGLSDDASPRQMAAYLNHAWRQLRQFTRQDGRKNVAII